MADGYRLKIKLPSGAEFDAEGSEESVRDLFNKFLEAIEGMPKAPQAGHAVPPAGSPEVVVTDDSPGERTAATMSTALLGRLFLLGKDGTVTLRALPPTETRDADALLALIYGYLAIKKEHTVTGSTLKRAARQSGIQLDRVDRVLGPFDTWVTTAGFKKGRRYGLNNQGVRKAEAILTQIMG